MSYTYTPAQEVQRDTMREKLHDETVPKALRSKALFLAKEMPRGENKNHAMSWLLHSHW